MAIKEIKREWSPSQCDYVKHYLLHWERDVKDLPACCVGSRATVGETDHEYVCTECGWVRAEYTELVKICPSILSDPDVKILYDPERTEVAEAEFKDNTDIEVVYFPNVKTIRKNAFANSSIKVAIFPNTETAYNTCFNHCVNLESVYMPKLVTNYYGVFLGCEALTDATFPEWETLAKGDEFSRCSNLVRLRLPKVKDISYYSFSDCENLAKADFPSLITLNGRAFQKSGLTTLILRNSVVCTLTTAFRNDPIASGTGYIYVPAALIDSYKAATNWSTYANQFRAIEDYPHICDPEWKQPEPDAAHQMLVSNENGEQVWEDRTHYAEIVTEVLFDGNVTTSDGWNTAQYDPISFDVLIDSKYKVVYDGTEYTLTSVSGDDGISYIGSGTLWMSQDYDTSEPPFCYGDGWFAASVDGEHTVSIARVVEAVHALDEKYLPDSVKAKPDFLQNDSSAFDYVKNRTHSVEFERTLLMQADSGWHEGHVKYQNIVDIPDGVDYNFKLNDVYENYILVVGGKEYRATTVTEGEELQFANASGEWIYMVQNYKAGHSYRGEKVIFYANGFIPTDTVYLYKQTPSAFHQLDARFLPPDITISSGGSLAITDSAGAKWKLVVGTDGTLSTEAVTE